MPKNYVITKKELAYTIHKKTGVMEERAVLVIDAMMAIINEELALGNDIALRTFGTFGTKIAKARKGRIVTTGEIIDVPAKYKPFFRPSPEMFKKCAEREIETEKQQ